VDISEDMLRLATRKASAQNLRIRFLQKDIAKLDFKEQFDAAYILFNTVSLLTRNEDILGFFKGVHKSLKKGGLLVIEVGNMWSYIAEGTFHNMSGERDEEREGIGRRINVKTAIGPYNNVYCHESASRYWRNSEELQLRTRIDCTRIFSVNEFGLLCRLTAFEILGIFGSTDFSKKIENPHIIEVVEKPYHGFVLVLSKRE
jgi:SAM-dependent methyltransferase